MYKWVFKSQLLALNLNKYLLIQHNTYVFVFYTIYSDINKNRINVYVGIDIYPRVTLARLCPLCYLKGLLWAA